MRTTVATADGTGKNVSSSVSVLPGVGPTRARALAAAGVHTVADVLLHLPLRWIEHPPAVPLAAAELVAGSMAVIGRLEGLQLRRPRRGMTLVTGRLVDGAQALSVVWFHQPWRSELGPGPWLARGELQRNNFGWQLVTPELLPAEDAVTGSTATAVYPALAQLPPRLVRRLVGAALEVVDTLAEPLPAELLARRGLPPIGEALRRLHTLPGAEKALQRLVWGELLEHQLLVLARRARRRERAKGHHYRVDDHTRAAARAVLPFPLTAAQRRALGEIVTDLTQLGAMARLLHGDVGSGKTLVAVLAMLLAAESGLQAVLLAPTEVLAGQHARSLERLLAGRHRVGLVTAEQQDSATLRALARGELRLAVGTHALLSEGVAFRDLALVVVDEQHRFGVGQRAALYAKGRRPDLLLLSATPIPRSLALSDFGDLDLSVLDELPPGRAGIETALLPSSRRAALERRLEQVLAAGERVFVVVPRIDGNSDGVPSLEVEGARWREALGPARTAVVHGRLAPGELRSAVDALRAGRIQALVATSVIEVGLDVPEATWMVIDGAESFGLAQLHQLRGRVGRGAQPGRCLALHGELGEASRARLEAFAATTDGFALAEADLTLRGPGDLLGRRQAGSGRLRFADPLRDRELLGWAREDAAALLESPQGPAWVAAARARRLAHG